MYAVIKNFMNGDKKVVYKTNEKAWENVERKCRAKAEEYK